MNIVHIKIPKRVYPAAKYVHVYFYMDVYGEKK